MPYQSKAQQRFMFAAEARGEVPPGTAREWAHETPDIKKLPERKHPKKEDEERVKKKMSIEERQKKASEHAARFFDYRATQVPVSLKAQLQKIAADIRAGVRVGTAMRNNGFDLDGVNRVKVAHRIRKFAEDGE